MSWQTSVAPNGAFQRKDSVFRDTVKANSKFPPQANRYHLFISLACPWAHRCFIMRSLKGLEHVIGVTTVDWKLVKPPGWRFEGFGGEKDPIKGFSALAEYYQLADPGYQGNITVPVLWDKETNTIINNESGEILRILNSDFNEFCATPQQAQLDFYPESLRSVIDKINEFVYPQINNGVYRCGFAQSQEAYDAAFDLLADGLEKVENILSKSRYLAGDRITEADIRLFTTMIRYVPVYIVHFKCFVKPLSDYPNLFGLIKELYQIPEIRKTVNFEHIKRHYFESHGHINPTLITCRGPIHFEQQLAEPHGRDKLRSSQL